ncbi:4Fe-4S dicluster domain-containing protein [Adlercreutzia sp. ZJ242]|uniref:4Fe-4S dicluster domain-containing protein n=1 Tax=Adlercreutzia sp. ZJ242 TaxID=2709409 RepID=UPI0013EDE08A|nr:4Fe-4S dicluster domain-containing protein [Adlercreutzia sp. ZJ242]
MAALENFIKVISSLGSEALAVAPERCVQVRNKNARCLRCAEVCAAGAISYDGEDVLIDGDACIGCGTCATACPTCALEAMHPTDAELSDALAERASAGGDVVVACARALRRAHRAAERKAEEASGLLRRVSVDFDVSDVLQVVCLGRIDESFYAECAARGVSQVTLACDGCETCTYHRGGELARKVAASAHELLDAHGYELAAEFASPLPCSVYEKGTAARALGYDPSKRATIVTLREMTAQVARDSAVEALDPVSGEEAPEPRYAKVGPNGTLPQFVPLRRNRVMNSLHHVGEPVRALVTTRLWGQVDVDVDQCSSCAMCAMFCPTGALARRDDAEGNITLEHRPYRCVQCRLCEDICMTGALSVGDMVSLEDFERGRVQEIPLPPRAWTPNRPDSIFTKMNALVGGSNNSYF